MGEICLLSVYIFGWTEAAFLSVANLAGASVVAESKQPWKSTTVLLLLLEKAISKFVGRPAFSFLASFY